VWRSRSCSWRRAGVRRRRLRRFYEQPLLNRHLSRPRFSRLRDRRLRASRPVFRSDRTLPWRDHAYRRPHLYCHRRPIPRVRRSPRRNQGRGPRHHLRRWRSRPRLFRRLRDLRQRRKPVHRLRHRYPLYLRRERARTWGHRQYRELRRDQIPPSWRPLRLRRLRWGLESRRRRHQRRCGRRRFEQPRRRGLRLRRRSRRWRLRLARHRWQTISVSRSTTSALETSRTHSRSMRCCSKSTRKAPKFTTISVCCIRIVVTPTARSPSSSAPSCLRRGT